MVGLSSSGNANSARSTTSISNAPCSFARSMNHLATGRATAAGSGTGDHDHQPRSVHGCGGEIVAIVGGVTGSPRADPGSPGGDQSDQPSATSPHPTAADLAGAAAGRLAIVEPLTAEHESGLVDAAAESSVFDWLPVDVASSREAIEGWLRATLQSARAGRDVPFAIIDARTGRVVGSTRFLDLRLEHLRAEIGWTWLARSAWSTGIDVKDQVHAVGPRLRSTPGCAGSSSRPTLAMSARGVRCWRSGRSSRGSCASTWSSATDTHGTRPTTR